MWIHSSKGIERGEAVDCEEAGEWVQQGDGEEEQEGVVQQQGEGHQGVRRWEEIHT